MLLSVSRQTPTYPYLDGCSAGVGRTGTLIGLDILLQCVKAKKKIDIFGVVLKLREQRPFMVQTQVNRHWKDASRPDRSRCRFVSVRPPCSRRCVAGGW